MSRRTGKSPLGGKAKPWMLVGAAFVIAPLIGYQWLISVGFLAFLILILLAVALHLGFDRFSNYVKTKSGVGVLVFCGIALLTLPPYVEPLGRLIALQFTQPWEYITKEGERKQRLLKLHIIWGVDETSFSTKDQKFLKQWNPLTEDNIATRKNMLAATWMQGIEANVIVPFDSTEVDEDDPFFMIIFDEIRVKVPIENPKKDGPTEKLKSYLKVTFITPTTTSPKTETKGQEKDEKHELDLKKPRFNKYVVFVDDLNVDIFDFIDIGFQKSLRGEKGQTTIGSSTSATPKTEGNQK